MKLMAVMLFAVAPFLWGAEPVVSWEKTRDVIGQRATVEGVIVATHKTEKICNLNFSPNWKTEFSAVIFSRSFSKWRGDIEEQYRGRNVRITGTVTEYQSRPQIIVTDPSQIEIMKELTVATPPPANSSVPPVVVTTTPVPPVPATPPSLPVMQGQAAAATTSATSNVSVSSVDSLTLSKEVLPFTVEVKRFTGAKQGSGVVTKTEASFFQTVRLNMIMSSLRNAPVGPLEWQWVIGLLEVSSSGNLKQQFFTGGDRQMELKPLGKKVVRSDDVTLAGMSSSRGMKSGQRLRGHFVRLFYQGRLVFEDANPPNMKSVAESYLAGK
ncbi:MAG: hypothetical protein NT105_23540 [Verrucomicrobia bacterium]|nr:hypothetical protein [Verrucomicrobiota bacterium]